MNKEIDYESLNKLRALLNLAYVGRDIPEKLREILQELQDVFDSRKPLSLSIPTTYRLVCIELDTNKQCIRVSPPDLNVHPGDTIVFYSRNTEATVQFKNAPAGWATNTYPIPNFEKAGPQGAVTLFVPYNTPYGFKSEFGAKAPDYPSCNGSDPPEMIVNGS